MTNNQQHQQTHAWINDIDSVRRRTRTILIVQRCCVLVGWTSAILMFLAGADYLLRLPGVARSLQLVVLLAILGAVCWKYVLPVIRFAPSLTDLALRVEALVPKMRGRLTSGLEFAMAGADQDSELAARAVEDAQRHLRQTNLKELINPKRAYADAGLSALALAVVMLFAMLAPAHTAIAAKRIFLPFGDAAWPRRTGVESEMEQSVHPLGRALSLTCDITRGFSSDMRVTAHYRVFPLPGSATKTPTEERVLLTHQRDSVFDRLIEPNGQAIEIWFETEDDQTAPQRIELVPPPEIVEASLEVIPPDYALAHMESTAINLGSGTDARAVRAQPVLQGAAVSLTLTLNKPINLMQPDRTWREILGWEEDVINGIDATPSSDEHDQLMQDTTLTEVDITPIAPTDNASAVWSLRWQMKRNIRLNPVLIDEHQIYGPDDVHFRIDMVQDHSPNISITNPISDRAVLPTATIPLSVEARDDVAVSLIRVEAIRQSPTGEVNLLDPQQTNDAADSNVHLVAERTEVNDRVMVLESILDLQSLDAQPGEIVYVYGIAADAFVLGTRTHDAVRSTPRRLRILTEAEFVEQVFRDLTGVRDRAIEIEKEQHELRSQLTDRRANPTDEATGRPTSTISSKDRRDQARLTERINRQREQLQQIKERVGENNLNADDIERVIDEATQQLNEAGQSSDQASARLAEAEQQQKQRLDAPTPSVDESDDERAMRDDVNTDQEDVEESLANLIDALDRGEDAWGARRDIERLLDEQRDLADQSKNLTDQTRGKSLDELNNSEQEELAGLTADQKALAQKAQELIDDLRERSQKTEQTNPDLAQSMDEAAQQAEESSLQQDMQQASQQLSQNKGSLAEQSQEQAKKTLEEMLETLENTERSRLERLSRELASLAESIKGLVADQEGALESLATAEAQQININTLDAGMIQLNRNTYSIADFARQTDPKLEPVARRITDAAGSQESAIVNLRHVPAQPADAKSNEQASLGQLREALEMVEQMKQQNEEDLTDQKREELKKAYLDLHERQTAFIKETQPFIAKMSSQEKMSRRERIEARQHATRQSELQTDADNLLQKTEDLADAFVFVAGHQQADTMAQKVVDAYRQGDVQITTLFHEEGIAALFLAMANALEDESPDEDEFDEAGDGQQAGGGQGQGGGQPEGLILPATQLKLLKGMQEIVYRATRSIGEMESLSESIRQGRSAEIGADQQDILNLTNKMLEQMQEGQPGGGPMQQPPPPPGDDDNNGGSNDN